MNSSDMQRVLELLQSDYVVKVGLMRRLFHNVVAGIPSASIVWLLACSGPLAHLVCSCRLRHLLSRLCRCNKCATTNLRCTGSARCEE